MAAFITYKEVGNMKYDKKYKNLHKRLQFNRGFFNLSADVFHWWKI